MPPVAPKMSVTGPWPSAAAAVLLACLAAEAAAAARGALAPLSLATENKPAGMERSMMSEKGIR